MGLTATIDVDVWGAQVCAHGVEPSWGLDFRMALRASCACACLLPDGAGCRGPGGEHAVAYERSQPESESGGASISAAITLAAVMGKSKERVA
jgi:hypothetical protein